MKLLTKESANKIVMDNWKQDAIKKFEKKLSDQEKPFPCIPACRGHNLNHLRYGFVSDPREKCSTEELAQILEIYSANFQNYGEYTSLIVFYESSQDLIETTKLEEYEQIFWNQLMALNKLDSKNWPSPIPSNPNHPLWEFCFHGQQYFMYCATPAHQKRRSRHFPYFMLAITPRQVLDQLYRTTPDVPKLKNNIRKRLAEYDSIPIHPDLNNYGQDDNYEWKQYFLHDDESTLPKCPFHQSTNIADSRTE